MERRKFVIGVGSLAAGAAAATGTGAFTSVEADRDAEVNLATDADAYLALTPGNENGWAASPTVGNSPDGVLALEMNGQSQTSGGTGVNANALSVFDDVFHIGNQGANNADVYIEFDPASSSVVNQSSLSQSDWEDRIDFYRGNFNAQGSTPPVTPSTSSVVGSGNATQINTGAAAAIGIAVDLRGLSASDYSGGGPGADSGQFLTDITVHADAI
jgi:hypothetical protein